MLKAILIDDEPGALSALETILKDFFSEMIQVVSVASSALSGIKEIQRFSPDVVFLDIEMQGGSGFDVAESFPNRQFKIVFVTAYEEYALRALKVKAHDYLLKPIDIDELEKLIQELCVQKELLGKGISESTKICLPTLHESHFVEPTEILYIRADGRYSEVMLLSGKKIFLSRNLGSFEVELVKYNFLRIHKSFLVNLTHISGIVNNTGWNAVMSNGIEIEISRKRIAELKAVLHHTKS